MNSEPDTKIAINTLLLPKKETNIILILKKQQISFL